jgi:hypothetical protein
MRLNSEIRYFAGTAEPHSDNPEYEIGIFPSIVAALSFGNYYLLAQYSFSEIAVERTVRDSSRLH